MKQGKVYKECSGSKAEGVMLTVVSALSPQVGLVAESGKSGKSDDWRDFSGHVGEANTGDDQVLGWYGVKVRNVEADEFCEKNRNGCGSEGNCQEDMQCMLWMEDRRQSKAKVGQSKR